MRILFVAQAVSIHTARWISQLSDQDWDIHLFDMLGSFPHAELRGITEYSLLVPRRIPLSPGPVSYGNPYFLKHGLDPFPLSLIGYITRRIFRKRTKLLARTIERLKPDIIHSMEMHTESYPLLDVIKILGGKMPAPWILTTWGNDIYYFRQFPDYAVRIKEILQHCDYLVPDCIRDENLAREYGFKGTVPMIVPGAGGYPVAEMRNQMRAGPVADRRIIMVKGYHHWAGRALYALHALEACADVLQDYEVILYSISPAILEEVRSVQKARKINITILARSPHSRILEIFGSARIAIGISVTDGIPNAMLEAMTMNAFPIQSNTGSTTEWITDGVNGFVVDPEDTGRLAEVIRIALQNDRLVNRAAEINTDIMLKRLDISVIKPRVIEMYESIKAKARMN